jgi:hypothetical protein
MDLNCVVVCLILTAKGARNSVLKLTEGTLTWATQAVLRSARVQVTQHARWKIDDVHLQK